MPLHLPKPIIYLITSGETEPITTPQSEDFQRLLNLVKAAVDANVDLLQLREKNLSARVLYDLATQAARITEGSRTRLLVNDRADIASGSRAHGVHLTTKSLEASVIRHTFGDDFLIGVSTHSLSEARDAGEAGADFAVFGPVFNTDSKSKYGDPLGLQVIKEVTTELVPFPVLALGGVTLENVADCFRAGASGIAAIRLLSDPDELSRIVDAIHTAFSELQR